jgi:hypothetical protein
VRVLTAVGRRRKIVLALAIALCLAASAAAQRGRRGFGGGRFQTRLEPNAAYDGAFRFCRIMFRQNPNGDGGGWSVDYPRPISTLMPSLELTSTRRPERPAMQPCRLSATDASFKCHSSW